MGECWGGSAGVFCFVPGSDGLCFLQGLLIAFAYKRYKMGVEDFAHSYVDPSSEVSTPYSSYPNISHDSYQQPPFTQTTDATEGYQPPPVY